METKVREIIAECKAAAKRPGAFGYLPGIVRTLEAIHSELQKSEFDPGTLVMLAGGLGRLVTDSYAFSESPLGGKLLDLVTEIVSQYDPRFRQANGTG